MDPDSGRLYPSADAAKAAGVPNPVELRGDLEDVRRVSRAVSELRLSELLRAAGDASHECPKDGCAARVRRNLLACGPHWALVSPATQREVYAAYRTRSSDILRHLHAVQAAVAEMNRSSGDGPAAADTGPATARPPRDLAHEAECWACQNGKHCAWREWGCGRDDHEPADSCTCATSGWCGESSEAGCCACVHSDPYDPCPVFGYGCGFGAPADGPRCDCCTPEQFAAARGRAS